MRNAFGNVALIFLTTLFVGSCGRKNESSPSTDIPPYAWIVIDISASMAGFFKPTGNNVSKAHSTLQRIMGTDELINLLNFPHPLATHVSTAGVTVSNAERVDSLSKWSKGTHKSLIQGIYKETDSRFPDLFQPSRWKELAGYRVVILITDLAVDFGPLAAPWSARKSASEVVKTTSKPDTEIETQCNKGNDVGCMAGRLANYLGKHSTAGLWIIGLRDKFDGNYYPVGGGSFPCKAQRPVYLLILSSDHGLGWKVVNSIVEKISDMNLGTQRELLRAVAFSPPLYDFRRPEKVDVGQPLGYEAKEKVWRCSSPNQEVVDLVPRSGTDKFKVDLALSTKVTVDKWGVVEDKSDGSKRLIIKCGDVFPDKHELKLKISFLPPAPPVQGESREWWRQWHTGTETEKTCGQTKNLYHFITTLSEKISEAKIETSQEFKLWK